MPCQWLVVNPEDESFVLDHEAPLEYDYLRDMVFRRVVIMESVWRLGIVGVA